LIYWGAYDWQTDFPTGVDYTIGESYPATDFNTVHWAVFGPTPDNPDIEYNTTHDWKIRFNLSKKQLQRRKTAILTIQLAGAKTAAGNMDVYSATEPYTNLPLESYINDQEEPLTLLVGFNQSSSCIVRSAVSCYQVRERWEFPDEWLKVGENVLTLHLPFNGTNTEAHMVLCSCLHSNMFLYM
jgi:rhamnogalacturonan endolyase